ncbi:MAG: ABC transporter ATP-binding protein [Oligoflexia bacterium]|nr:ABC transporter ATP-binding protein [Oligoflexia bacterium]
MKEIIRTEKVTKIYRTGEIEVAALRDVSVCINEGEFTAIAGPSGSGKSTFLNIISGLDHPTSGDAYISGSRINDISGTKLSDFRRDNIGFVFQSFNLIPVLSVTENIEYVMLLQGIPRKERSERVAAILSEVGLEGMENRMPFQLSGGQQQRVAVARAIVTSPGIILADEPTANLDSATGAALLDMMKKLNKKKNMTFIFSTHDRNIMDVSRRLIVLKDGRIEKDEVRG